MTEPTERAERIRAETFGHDLTVQEVAHILDVDRTTVLRYLRDNTIFGYQLGREWHIPQDEFTQRVDEMRHGNASRIVALAAALDQRDEEVKALVAENERLRRVVDKWERSEQAKTVVLQDAIDQPKPDMSDTYFDWIKQ